MSGISLTSSSLFDLAILCVYFIFTAITAFIRSTHANPSQVQRAQAIAHSFGRDVVGWEEIWDNFGTKLNPSTIIQQWIPGSTIGPAVVQAGYRLIWSTDGVWFVSR